MASGADAISRVVTLRPARASDGDQIAAIWNHEVLWTDATTETEPRSPEAQRAWLAWHAAAHPVVVAAAGDEVVGYGSLSPYRPRPAFATAVEDSVYVKRGCRGRGLGTLILRDLVRLARARGHHSVIARITSTNEPSLRVHQRLGFRLLGIEREIARKHGRWLDVAVLQLLLDG